MKFGFLLILYIAFIIAINGILQSVVDGTFFWWEAPVLFVGLLYFLGFTTYIIKKFLLRK